MSLYGSYLKEKTNVHIVEDEKGFATYRYTEDGAVYIIDIYVTPDYRHSGVASEMADKIGTIAKRNGISRMYGSINLETKQCTDSLKVLLAYGFQLHSSSANFLLLSKEL